MYDDLLTTKDTKKSNIKPFVLFVSFVVIFHGQGDRSEPVEQATGDAEAPGLAQDE